jgi:hypothetical protein
MSRSPGYPERPWSTALAAGFASAPRLPCWGSSWPPTWCSPVRPGGGPALDYRGAGMAQAGEVRALHHDRFLELRLLYRIDPYLAAFHAGARRGHWRAPVLEIALIDMQAARGTTSHFNVATRLTVPSLP